MTTTRNSFNASRCTSSSILQLLNMPEKAPPQPKVYASSKFRNVDTRIKSAPSGSSASQGADSGQNTTSGDRKWARDLVRTELPKGVKSEAALRNKQKQETGVLNELLKHATKNESSGQTIVPPRCTTKAALEIRAKLMDSEMAKVLDSRQSYELPVAKPRCQGREAMSNWSKQTESKIDFDNMFSDDLDRTDVKTKFGVSQECARNSMKSQGSAGMANSLSHDYERELTPRRPPRLNYGGISTAARMQGDQMNLVLHGQHEELEQPKIKVGSSNAARVVYEKNRGTGDVWLRGDHEADDPPAPRVRYGGQRNAANATGSAIQEVLQEQLHDPPDYEQPSLRLTSQAARRNYEGATGLALKNSVFSDYRSAPLNEKPAPRTRSNLAEEVRNYHTKGLAHTLLYQYGKLMGDPKPSPTLRSGAYGIYRKSQGDSIRQLMHREAFHGPSKSRYRRRPKSANA